MASAQVVETSVNNNSPSQDSYHPDDLFQSRYATPGFKPFSYLSHVSVSAIISMLLSTTQSSKAIALFLTDLALKGVNKKLCESNSLEEFECVNYNQ